MTCHCSTEPIGLYAQAVVSDAHSVNPARIILQTIKKKQTQLIQ